MSGIRHITTILLYSSPSIILSRSSSLLWLSPSCSFNSSSQPSSNHVTSVPPSADARIQPSGTNPLKRKRNKHTLLPSSLSTSPPKPSSYPLINQIPTMSPFPFLSLLESLKNIRRSGWVRRGLPEPMIESVSDHMYRVAVMCRMAPGVKFSPTNFTLLLLLLLSPLTSLPVRRGDARESRMDGFGARYGRSGYWRHDGRGRYKSP